MYPTFQKSVGEESVQETTLRTEQNTKQLNALDQIIKYFNLGLAWIAGLCLVLMILLIVFNGIKRIFSDPFAGTTEVAGWLGAIAISFAIGYTQLHHGHVDIDLLVQKFPERLQKFISILVSLASLLFFLIVGWQIIRYGLSLMEGNHLSPTLRISFYPLVLLTSLGFFGLTLALFKDFIDQLRR